MKHRKLAALLGAGLLTLGVSGIALADGTVYWDGSQGLGQDGLPNVQCDSDNAAGTVTFIFTLGGADESVSSATLHLGGSGSGDFVGSKNGHEFHLQATFSGDFSTLTANVTYVGTLGTGNVNLTISHYCPGEGETSPPTEQPTETPAETPAGTPTETPGGGGGGDTSQPSQPSTDSAFGTGTSGPSDTAWLLVVALGVLLASVVVLTPARAKNRR